MLRSAYPPGGTPLDSLIPQALVVVDSRQGGPPNFETESDRVSAHRENDCNGCGCSVGSTVAGGRSVLQGRFVRPASERLSGGPRAMNAQKTSEISPFFKVGNRTASAHRPKEAKIGVSL